ncbi:hydroxymethylglutaryl-CoA lyase [Cryptosporangium sp. NPDC048952]|uniref:hydroxymethylglutaryl-CoA lyase n=1 Tax=Cryptosporangium sp. NPDC048952 TaxID=3363961 RepID=UPI00371BEC00
MSGPVKPGTLWKPVPRPVPDPDLPRTVRVYEVGPRDGLQAETDVVPAATKAELCRRLLAAGAGKAGLEVTSFVPPSWIPQLADAAEVSAEVLPGASGRTVALVPNSRGLYNAMNAGYDDVAVVVSATDSFAAANLNTTARGSLETAAKVTAEANNAGRNVRGYLSMSFGDPWEGDVSAAKVATMAAELHAAGCTTVALGDTVGLGTPGQVTDVIRRTVEAGVPKTALAMHFHDTYGQGLANVLAALKSGVTEFDAAVGGLGRCPYAAGATGNLATEDLVWMLHGLGIDTGLDLTALVRTSRWLAAERGTTGPSRVLKALSAHVPEEDDQ